jgi:DNA-binding beta-propeller fold protein YncE
MIRPLLVSAILFSFAYASSQPKAEVAFRIPERDLIPEGIAYDPVDKNFFLGSIQKSKVIRIALSGKITDFVTDGLLNVLGMKVHGRKLWVCNNTPEHDTTTFISNLHIFDLPTGKLFKKYTLNDGTKHLFNDVVISSAGTGYVTDSNGGAIYVVKQDSDTLEALVSRGGIRYPNGIALTPDEKKLVVSTGSGLGIVLIDIATRAITPLQSERFLLIGFDGLYRSKNSLIGIQNVTYPEAILEIRCNDTFTAVTEIRPKAISLPEFDTPTTGVLVGDYLYFIANSQLMQVTGGGGKIKDPAALKETVIMRVKVE